MNTYLCNCITSCHMRHRSATLGCLCPLFFSCGHVYVFKHTSLFLEYLMSILNSYIRKNNKVARTKLSSCSVVGCLAVLGDLMGTQDSYMEIALSVAASTFCRQTLAEPRTGDVIPPSPPWCQRISPAVFSQRLTPLKTHRCSPFSFSWVF